MIDVKEKIRLSLDKAANLNNYERVFSEAQSAFSDQYVAAAMVMHYGTWTGGLNAPQGFMSRFILTTADGRTETCLHRDGTLHSDSNKGVSFELYTLWDSLRRIERRARDEGPYGSGTILIRKSYLLVMHPSPERAKIIPSPFLTADELLAIPERVMSDYPGRFVFEPNSAAFDEISFAMTRKAPPIPIVLDQSYRRELLAGAFTSAMWLMPATYLRAAFTRGIGPWNQFITEDQYIRITTVTAEGETVSIGIDEFFALPPDSEEAATWRRIWAPLNQVATYGTPTRDVSTGVAGILHRDFAIRLYQDHADLCIRDAESGHGQINAIADIETAYPRRFDFSAIR